MLVQDKSESLPVVLKHMDNRSCAANHSPAHLNWPAHVRASRNFWKATSSTTPGAPYTRRSGFVLTCADGSALLLSEREAHYVREAHILSSAARRGKATASLSHIAFLRPALPATTASAPQPSGMARLLPLLSSGSADHGPARPLWSVGAAVNGENAPQQQAQAVVAAQLFAGDAVFQQMHHSTRTQDAERLKLVEQCLIAATGRSVDATTLRARVMQLLSHRGRDMHFTDSDLDDIVQRVATKQRTAAMAASAGVRKQGAATGETHHVSVRTY